MTISPQTETLETEIDTAISPWGQSVTHRFSRYFSPPWEQLLGRFRYSGYSHLKLSQKMPTE